MKVLTEYLKFHTKTHRAYVHMTPQVEEIVRKSAVKEGMALAHVIGPQATPKGLRHAFAVTALQSGIPINLVRRWLGHSRLSTTEIYADAIGPEERAIAGRFWESF